MLRPYRSRNLLGHLLPHLVAAGADRRADDRLQARSQRAARDLDDAVDQAPPTGVDDGQRRSIPVRASEGQEHAVGPEREHRDARLIGPEAVTRDPSRARLRSVDDRRVRLEADRELLLVRADLRAQAPPVLVDVRDVVARLAAEIEGLERAHADAAASSREDDLAAGGIPAEDRNRHDCSTSSRAAASSDSFPSSSPFSFRRRSSPRISPTRGDSPRPSSAMSAPVTSRRVPRRRSKYSWR